MGWPVVALVSLAVLLGGGGLRYAFLNLTVQLFAIALLFWFGASVARNLADRPKALILLAAASILLPLIQLIPLPPSVWQALPGGDLALESRSLVGVADEWFPWSLDRARTVLAAIGLIAPFAVLALYDARSRSAGQTGLRLIVLLALLHFAFGSLQILAGEHLFLPYPVLEKGRLYGLFANHNSSGLMLVIGLCALGGIRSEHRRDDWQRRIIPVIGLLFIIGTVLSQSRSSVTLMLLPLSVAAFRMIRRQITEGQRGKLIYWAVGAAVLVAAGAFMATNARVGETFDRFDNLEDSRPDIWADSLVSIDRFWPIGSGMGTFDEVFQLDESLETLLPTYARRAHNDYLEIGVEAGILGWLLVAGWICWAVLSYWRQRGGSGGASAQSAGLALLCIALQSLVDYPLRNQALLCLAALLTAMLAARPANSRTGSIE